MLPFSSLASWLRRWGKQYLRFLTKKSMLFTYFAEIGNGLNSDYTLTIERPFDISTSGAPAVGNTASGLNSCC